MLPKDLILNYDKKIDNSDDIEKIISIALQKNYLFFGNKTPSFAVTFLYSRKQMDKVAGRKTEAWVVGYTKEKNIYIFSPSVFSKVSDHKSSDFGYVLTHEIAHIFTNEFIGLVYPRWLVEGLAGYIAGQDKIKPVNKITDFSLLHDSVSWNKNFNYPQSYSFTSFLINKIGKQKALIFFKKVTEKVGVNNQIENFDTLFEKEFNMTFLKLVKSWKHTL